MSEGGVQVRAELQDAEIAHEDHALRKWGVHITFHTVSPQLAAVACAEVIHDRLELTRRGVEGADAVWLGDGQSV